MKWLYDIIDKVQKVAAYVAYIAAVVAWASDSLANFPKPSQAIIARLGASGATGQPDGDGSGTV